MKRKNRPGTGEYRLKRLVMFFHQVTESSVPLSVLSWPSKIDKYNAVNWTHWPHPWIFVWTVHSQQIKPVAAKKILGYPFLKKSQLIHSPPRATFLCVVSLRPGVTSFKRFNIHFKHGGSFRRSRWSRRRERPWALDQQPTIVTMTQLNYLELKWIWEKNHIQSFLNEFQFHLKLLVAWVRY